MPKAEDFNSCRTFYQHTGNQKQNLAVIEQVLATINEIVSQHCWKEGRLTDFGRACSALNNTELSPDLFRDLMTARCYSAAKLQIKHLLAVYYELMVKHAV
jgi:hypothetical protein